MNDGTGCYRDSLTGYERSSYSTLFANSSYRLKPDGMGLWPSKSMMKTLVALIGNAHSTDTADVSSGMPGTLKESHPVMMIAEPMLT